MTRYMARAQTKPAEFPHRVEMIVPKGVSKRWLQKFLRQHPVDTAGVPFYIPIGNRKRFTERDLERILEMNRNAEKDRLLSAPPIHTDWPAENKTYEAFGNRSERPLSDRLARALVQLRK